MLTTVIINIEKPIDKTINMSVHFNQHVNIFQNARTFTEVIPFGLIKFTEFNENKFSRARRLIEQ